MTLDEAYRVAIAAMQQELSHIAHHVQDYESGIYNTETRYAVKRRGELTGAIALFEILIEKATMGKDPHQPT